eukprot:Selendium_serpulae@DN4961_c0_g2_i3.p1
MKAEDLTKDHKPDDPGEMARIVKRGGQVRKLEGDIPHRVFLKGKTYPGLAMSRAIGDTVAANAGVICDADTNEYPIKPNCDLFAILCSDGVWEFITSQEAVDIVTHFTPATFHLAAEKLAEESWKRWIESEGTVVDDITVEVVVLDRKLYGVTKTFKDIAISMKGQPTS